MNATKVEKQGFIPFHGHKVWYKIVGEGEESGKVPLLCLHGGPGASHDVLEPLEAVAETGRRVIFYDQLGGGNSDHPHNPSLWSVALFMEEVGEVRNALNLSNCHLFGHSWGAMLAMQYALTQPAGLTSLILASGAADMPYVVDERLRLRTELPPEVQETLTTA